MKLVKRRKVIVKLIKVPLLHVGHRDDASREMEHVVGGGVDPGFFK